MLFLNLLLDALLAFLLIRGMMTGWKRGFVRVVFMRMRRLTALLAALFLARPIGLLIGEAYFEQPLVGKIRELLVSALGEDAATASAERLADGLPSVLQGVLHLFGVDIDRISASAEAAGGSLLDGFAARIAEPTAAILGAVVAFVCLYFLTRLLLRLIVHLVSAIFSIPGLSFVNKLLGFAFGVFFALLTAWVLTTALAFFFELLQANGIAFFADFAIDKTYIAKYFYGLKPLELLLRL